MPGDARETRRLRAALDKARAVMETLARGEEAVPAELVGVRPEGSEKALERWAHGDSVVPKRGRPRKAEWRDVAPTQPLLAARQARDAVLRVGVWSLLGDIRAAAHRQGADLTMAALIERVNGNRNHVPPGIAPTLAYAGSADASAFFNEHLRSVLERLDQRHPNGALPVGLAPMDRTAALAHRWSHAWSNAACAVYADWLLRRGGGTIDGARRSLWDFNDRDGPVRFRPADGFTVIPTKGYRLHVDLWLRPVLAQVLAHDDARWSAEWVDGHWTPVRLAVHDLTARDVGDGAEGSRTLFRGLSVEMLYQAVFFERLSALLGSTDVLQEHAPTAHPLDGAEPARAGGIGHQPTADAVRRRHDGADPGGPATDDHVIALAPAQLDWQPAAAHDHADAGHDGVDTALTPIGQVDLWGTIASSTGWLDFAAMARTGDGWTDLPLELVDMPGSRHRTWLAMPPRESDIEPALLRQRLGDPGRCSWMYRRDGYGAFLTLGVDLRG